jgi:hypothetical protein
MGHTLMDLFQKNLYVLVELQLDWKDILTLKWTVLFTVENRCFLVSFTYNVTCTYFITYFFLLFAISLKMSDFTIIKLR